MFYDIAELENHANTKVTLTTIYRNLEQSMEFPKESFMTRLKEKLENIGKTDNFILVVVMLYNEWEKADLQHLKELCLNKGLWKAFYVFSCLLEVKSRNEENCRTIHRCFMESWYKLKKNVGDLVHPKIKDGIDYDKNERCDDYRYMMDFDSFKDFVFCFFFQKIYFLKLVESLVCFV